MCACMYVYVLHMCAYELVGQYCVAADVQLENKALQEKHVMVSYLTVGTER